MTMNAGPQSLPTTPAIDNAASAPSGVAARVAALKLTIDEPTTPEPAGESSATPAPAGGASLPADSGAAAAGAAPTNESTERLARINRVRAREAADEARRAEQQQGRARDTEMETLRKRVAELEPLNKTFESEESLLSYAETKGMSAEKIVTSLRARLHDPAAVARRETQTEAEKIRAEMKAMKDEHAAEIAKIRAEKEQSEQERAQTTKTTTFLGNAKTMTASHPRTARAIGTWKDEGLITFVNQVIAPHLPQVYDTQYLHDVLEDYFEKTHAFGGQPTPEATPANGASRPSTKNGAAQPATTLSNALTSGRESLVEEQPLHKLSREERIRRAREE